MTILFRSGLGQNRRGLWSARGTMNVLGSPCFGFTPRGFRFDLQRRALNLEGFVLDLDENVFDLRALRSNPRVFQ